MYCASGSLNGRHKLSQPHVTSGLFSRSPIRSHESSESQMMADYCELFTP